MAMRGLRGFAVSTLAVLAYSAAASGAASADPVQCAIDGSRPAAQCSSVSLALTPTATQLAASDLYFNPFLVNKRALGCVMTPCNDGSKDYACTFYYTATYKQCSTCCSTEAQKNR
jgi:hypothetical protein